MRVQIGTTLGPYQIVSPLGTGAMGEVYRARDSRLGREVAIKILTAAPGGDRMARFEREARATAILAHPNIVTIFDVGTQDDMPFLVSELLEGQTLRERLAAGPLDPDEAITLALQLVRGVSAAHALRIVHRDLKPENLFITRDGTLKILDFGLAKLKSDSLNTPDLSTAHMSQPGSLIGTPAYMAPEQLRGEPVDERADIFAIGAIIYEMVSGKRPFLRSSTAETFAAVLHQPALPLEARVPLPPTLERLITKCLEKDPSERYQSASDLDFGLALVLGELKRPGERQFVQAEGPLGASIAVLPFMDMSPARDQDYLCDGIAEELINSLTHIEGLRVVARSSSFQFREPALDIRAVGTRLGVSAVLEGSVRKAGERLRVTVQLIDVASGYHRWSQRYDRNVEDLFAVQDEIAETVVTALGGILSSEEKRALRRPETAMEGYEYFLRGRQLLHREGRVNVETARTMFERSIEIDPDYSPAYAGLADAYSWIYEWWGGSIADYEAADQASRKALELSPDLAEAHSSRGFVLSLRRRYPEAEVEFQEALRLNPNSFDAHYLYARTCFAWGHIEQSAELFRRAADVREEDFQSLMLLAQSLRKLGRFEEAQTANREGLRRAERRLELDPTDLRALSLGAGSLEDEGQRERAIQWAKRAVELYPDDAGVLINGACLRARMGLTEEALDLLEYTFSKGWGKRDWIEHDPDYDSLRDHPRFQALLKRLR